jgi:hypothetical protein
LKNNSTQLKEDTTFVVTTNGAATCSGLKIQLPTKTSPTTRSLSFFSPYWYTVVYTTDLAWAAGTNLPVLIQSSSGVTLSGGSFTVTVQ